MSRIAKSPIELPKGVEIKVTGRDLSVKGTKGNMQCTLHDFVDMTQQDNVLTIKPKQDRQDHWAMAGTFRALINNMVTGVSQGFDKKLQLIGVGYRAQVKGKTLNMSLGFSHPVEYVVPDDVTLEVRDQRVLSVTGIDKQRVGQVAAVIRAFKPPEPYKATGIRYVGERIARKEGKAGAK